MEVYFPTPIYTTEVENAHQFNLLLKEKIYQWQQEDNAGILRSNYAEARAWHSKTNMHKRQEFSELADLINKRILAIFETQKYDPEFPPDCQGMWANINPYGAYNRNHNHPGSLWSGVYYVQTPKKSGRLLVHDPRDQAHMQVPEFAKGSKPNFSHRAHLFLEPKPGRCVIFPAWLRHEVEPNMTDKTGQDGDRISISFNYHQSDNRVKK